MVTSRHSSVGISHIYIYIYIYSISTHTHIHTRLTMTWWHLASGNERQISVTVWFEDLRKFTITTSLHYSAALLQHRVGYRLRQETDWHTGMIVAKWQVQMDKLATGNNTLPEEHSLFCTFKVILQYFVGLGVIFNCFIVA